MIKVDELILIFYEYIDEFADDFIKRYFLFELNLHNSVTAFVLRENKIIDPDKIIPFGDESKLFLKSTSPDFGLSLHIDFINKLNDFFKEGNLIKIEKELENIKWAWLSENGEAIEFSIKYIYSYAVKLLSIERWHYLTDKKGNEVLDNIIDKISNNVKFQDY